MPIEFATAHLRFRFVGWTLAYSVTQDGFSLALAIHEVSRQYSLIYMNAYDIYVFFSKHIFLQQLASRISTKNNHGALGHEARSYYDVIRRQSGDISGYISNGAVVPLGCNCSKMPRGLHDPTPPGNSSFTPLMYHFIIFGVIQNEFEQNESKNAFFMCHVTVIVTMKYHWPTTVFELKFKWGFQITNSSNPD